MLNPKGVLASGAIYTIANLVNAAVPFALLPLLTKVLTPQDYGAVTMFTLVVTAMGALVGVNVHGAVNVRYAKKGEEGIANYVAGCLTILVVTTVLAMGLVLIAVEPLERWTHLPVSWLLAATLVAMAQFVVNILLAIWRAKREALSYGVFQVGQGMTNTFLSLGLVLGLGLAWQGRVLGQAFAIAAFMLVALLVLVRTQSVMWPPAKTDIGDALSYGIPLIPHALAGMVLLSADRFVLTGMIGDRELGIYAVAVQLGGVVSILADAFFKAYLPWLYDELQRNTQEAKLKIVGSIYLAFFGFAVSAAVVTLAGILFSGWIVGSAFTSALDYLFIIAMGNAFHGMYFSIVGILFFYKKTAHISVVTTVTCGIGVFLFPVFVHFLGIWGAALGFLIVRILMFSLAFFFSKSAINLPWGMPLESLFSILQPLKARLERQ